MKTATIANIIKRDLLSDRQAQPTAAKCYACGKGLVGDTSGRFCSLRCRDAFDAGIPAYDPDYASKSNPRWYSLRIGPQGFHIDCAGCGCRFDSKGPRCCSPECKGVYRDRQGRDRLLADVPFRVVKRKCEYEHCGRGIPNWRNGRRVSKATRFCSAKCKDRHNRLNPVLRRETAKKCPSNGPSNRVAP